MNGVSRPLRPGFCDLETAQMAPSHGADGREARGTGQMMA